MACMKVGSKNDAFQRKGQAWFCSTGLPSDIVVEVGEISFHLHKFPLLSRSGVIERLIAEGKEDFVIKLPNIPGGAITFELVAKFCYGMKLELNASNVVYLRCASEHLEMSEEYGDGNLMALSEVFLNQVVLRSWKDSIRALKTCDNVLPYAEQLGITKRCIESLTTKTSSDPNLFGVVGIDGNDGGPIQSPGGSVLWNGISTGACPKKPTSNWWYEDASNLSLPLYKKLISEMETRGVKQEIIAGSLCFYAKKYLPALNRRDDASEPSSRLGSGLLSEEDQKVLLEELDKLIPNQKGLLSTKFLVGLLRTAMILRASPNCISKLERRIGIQLNDATLEDLLMPNYSNSMETLYNVECVQRILDHFLANDEATCGGSPRSIENGELMGSPCLTPITMVAKVVDGFLAEVAPDVNLKLPKFQALAAAVPDYARPLDDGLYRAIDIYLKSHPSLTESEREQLCRLMDCQKLSLEACTHAAQNERLPLRIIVQVLFFEQLQLRTSIAGCLLVSENLDGSRQLLTSEHMLGPNDNPVLKVGMDSMRMRVSELEKECSSMRNEIEKLGRTKGSSAWESMLKRLGFGLKMKSQMCSAQEGLVSNCSNGVGKAQKVRDKHGKHRKNLSLEE